MKRLQENLKSDHENIMKEFVKQGGI
jgi:hypothetical protein